MFALDQLALNLNITRARRCGLVAAQAGWARGGGHRALEVGGVPRPTAPARRHCWGRTRRREPRPARPQARGAEMPESFWTDPLMYQGASDEMLAPRDPIPLADESWGCDLEAEVVVVTGDVPRGVTREEALEHILLVGLVNDVSCATSSRPSSPRASASPVQARLGAVAGARHARRARRALAGRQAPRPLKVDLNGQPFGRADAGVDMTFDFGTLIAHLAKTRNLGAGTIIGSGTVSNRDEDGGPGKPIAAAASAIPASPKSARWRRSSTASPRRPS
jgi:2-keto-4-pentenoate hydratase/2-oxohepta-3-ene-1,7-dioic acid hydratase in catechol pathway